MVLKFLFLFCLFSSILAISTSDRIQSIGIQTNKVCHDFVPPVSYPLAWRNESLVETRHGVKVADPYRWLEDPYSDKTKQFITAQNKLSELYLKNCDAWPKIHEKLTKTYNFKKYTPPQYHGDHYYFQMNTGLQHQSVYYRQKSLDDEPSVFLDPNGLSDDGTIAVTSFDFSGDAKMVAYGLSKSGSDWNKLKIRNVETGKDYPETLEGIKSSTTSWTSDNKGFFYNRYLKFGDGTEPDRNENQKVYYHRVGEPQEKDVLTIEFPNQSKSLFGQIAVNGKYLLVIVFVDDGSSQQNTYFVDLEKNGEIRGKLSLTPIFNADLSSTFGIVTVIGSKVVYRTNRHAANYRLIMVDLENPDEENWTTLIEEDPYDVLLDATQVDGNKILTVYLHDVKSVLKLFSLETGKLIRELPIGMDSVVSITDGKTQSEIFVHLQSFLTPGTIYRYDFADPNAKPTILYEMKPNIKGFDEKNFEVRQVFYHSLDGTRIPMFVVQKKTTKDKVGPKSTLLYGYGGFASSQLPQFNLDWFFFVNNFEGILAVANIRGGNEYGTKWYEAGKFLNKQNSYDDFHAAAEYLIENQYTTRDKLAIRGISNGGILVGVCINQRPNLYGAAVGLAGVMDLLRYHLFTGGSIGLGEYGDPEKSIYFHNFLKYSPLQNVHTPNSTQNQYPPTLITTADHDDRVPPLHSYKHTAALQHAVQGNMYQKNPILMKLLKDAGHNDGKPTYKLINFESDILTFLYRALHIEIDF